MTSKYSFNSYHKEGNLIKSKKDLKSAGQTGLIGQNCLIDSFFVFQITGTLL